jgi:triacylglycerol lipase
VKIEATDAAIFARAAEDMFAPGVLTPELDQRMAGWRIVGYITALDALFGLQLLNLGECVFYGFLAQNNADPTNYVAVVRGTELPIEWLSDFRFLPYPMAGGFVERGFAEIYSSMHFALAGDGGEVAARGIADVIPSGATVTFIGHSLGATLATYLCRDTAIAADGHFTVQGRFFASPKPGDDRYVTGFDKAVGHENYQTINYQLDIVPHMPPLGYVMLPNVRWLTASAGLPTTNLVANHDLHNYVARIRAEDQPGVHA